MPDVTHGAETRWMFPLQQPAPATGPVHAPPEIEAWFLAGQNLQLEYRTDDYLVLPNCETIGVKLRGGKELQIKAQTTAPVLFAMHQYSGRIDHWVRQSFESAALPDLKQTLFLGSQWHTVEKWRYLRKLSADGGTIVEVPTSEWPKTGCNFELTGIKVNASQAAWFSLAFEAFGQPEETRCILDRALQLLLAEGNPIPIVQLAGLSAMSYPAWLGTLID